MVSLLELLLQVIILLSPMYLDLRMLAISLFNLFFHALFQLLSKDPLLLDLVLYLLFAVGNDFIYFDHHDLKHVVDNQGGDDVALISALNAHEFLDHLKDLEEKDSQVLYVDLQRFFLADNNVTGSDLRTQKLLKLMKKREVRCC